MKTNYCLSGLTVNIVGDCIKFRSGNDDPEAMLALLRTYGANGRNPAWGQPGEHIPLAQVGRVLAHATR